MILENPTYDSDAYTVVIEDENGSIVPNATVNTSHIGQTLSVNIQLTGCAASCWGNITVEEISQ